MDSRITVGMSFHANFKLIRTLLREGYRRKSNGRCAPVYKAGIYIISHSYDQPKYKVGMGGSSYSRLRNGYNLCFSENKSFRLHYFVEVPGTTKDRKKFEMIALSRFRLNDQSRVIMNEFWSNEWILKPNKTKLKENLVSVLNNSTDWARVYTFSEDGYRCLDRVAPNGVTRLIAFDDLDPTLNERADCKWDRDRRKRQKRCEVEESKEEKKTLVKQYKARAKTLKEAREMYSDSEDEPVMDIVARQRDAL